MTSSHSTEVAQGERFEFGANWHQFLSTFSSATLDEARASLQNKLGRSSLDGLTFLDIGSGSGVFSLAARSLGATVTSFDYDPASVRCTQTLRERFFPNDPQWKVLEGSVLDPAFMASLPVADIVYSWGVLHHTGSMWAAMDAAAAKVRPDGGQLFIALYNDQDWRSRVWRGVKRLYNRNTACRWAVIGVVGFGVMWGKKVVGSLARGQNPVHYWTRYQSNRGMSAWYDMLDWLGGYPFEVASPEAVFYWAKDKGMGLAELRTCGAGYGCNEFVFQMGARD